MAFSGNIPLLKLIREVEKTQGQVARKADITETRFTRIIRGYVKPTPEEIKRICEILNCVPQEVGFDVIPNESMAGSEKQ